MCDEERKVEATTDEVAEVMDSLVDELDADSLQALLDGEAVEVTPTVLPVRWRERLSALWADGEPMRITIQGHSKGIGSAIGFGVGMFGGPLAWVTAPLGAIVGRKLGPTAASIMYSAQIPSVDELRRRAVEKIARETGVQVPIEAVSIHEELPGNASRQMGANEPITFGRHVWPSYWSSLDMRPIWSECSQGGHAYVVVFRGSELKEMELHID